MSVMLYHIFVFFLTCFASNTTGMNVKSQEENYEPNYSYYHNSSQAIAEIDNLIHKYKDYIQSLEKYKSRSGLSQLVLRVTNFTNPSQQKRVKILLAYGEHAREFFPIESMFHFLKNLTMDLDMAANCSFGQSFSEWVLNHFDIYIIALANPDGKEHIEKSKNYCWRGNRNGVDINRNFDWNFGDVGSSTDPNDGEYRGPIAFSEPETEVFRELVTKERFLAFISFHSGIRHIYIPFADTHSKHVKRAPKNFYRMLELAKILAKASPSRPFQAGLAYVLNGYTADGTSFDYMAGVAKIPFSLAIEMWGHKNHVGSSCFDEFNPESEKLEEELQLIHPLYVQFLNYLYKWRKENTYLMESEEDSEIKLKRSLVDIQQVEQPLENLKDTQSTKSSTFMEESLFYMILALMAVLLAIIGFRYFFNVNRKKRIISLKSLSSTFLLFRRL